MFRDSNMKTESMNVIIRIKYYISSKNEKKVPLEEK